MIRLLLVEHEPLIGRGLRMWLRQASREVCVVAEVNTTAEALTLAQELAPDVVLLDLAAPAAETVAAATASLRSAAPGSAVVLLSLHDDATRRREALAAGASAFVGKQEGVAALLRAILEAVPGIKRSMRPSDG